MAADAIFGTLPSLASSRFTGALVPIELVNDVVSLSTYPSAHILKIFAEAAAFKNGSHSTHNIQAPLPL